MAKVALTLHLVLLSERDWTRIMKLDSASENPVINQGFNLSILDLKLLCESKELLFVEYLAICLERTFTW